jgi:hypothetical protein
MPGFELYNFDYVPPAIENNITKLSLRAKFEDTQSYRLTEVKGVLGRKFHINEV